MRLTSPCCGTAGTPAPSDPPASSTRTTSSRSWSGARGHHPRAAARASRRRRARPWSSAACRTAWGAPRHRPQGRLWRDRGPLRAGREPAAPSWRGPSSGPTEIAAGEVLVARQAGDHPERRRGARSLPHRLRVRGPQGRGPHPHPLGAREHHHHRLAPPAERLRLDHRPTRSKAKVRADGRPAGHQGAIAVHRRRAA